MIPTIRTPEDGTYEVEPTEDGLYLYHDAGQVTLIHVPTRYAAQLASRDAIYISASDGLAHLCFWSSSPGRVRLESLR